jgi:hypothetical protein
MFVTARELAERERKRLDVKKATYKAILEQFSRKISNAASLGSHDLILTTPTFVIGYPVYDVSVATAYIQRQLTRLGYKTRLVTPTSLHVSWSKPEPSTHTVVIDHSQEEDMSGLASLARTANKIRAKR